VHHNSVKVWTYEPATRKIKHFNCALGKINRYIICLSIDEIDEHAFCGTRSGDVLELSLSKGIFSRSGPINKKFSGAVNHVLAKDKSVYAAVADGTFARLDKATLTVASAANYAASQMTSLCASSAKVYAITSRGDMRSVADSDPVGDASEFMCGPSSMIAGLTFHSNYCGVFASCSEDQIRLWSPENCRELLRIELMQGSELDFARSNCVEFMPDGKSIVSGWTDGKIRCFTPQSGKLLWILTDAHKPGSKSEGGVLCVQAAQDGQNIVSGG
jgi:cilia- and flagella-associated protein 52